MNTLLPYGLSMGQEEAEPALAAVCQGMFASFTWVIDAGSRLSRGPGLPAVTYCSSFSKVHEFQCNCPVWILSDASCKW